MSIVVIFKRKPIEIFAFNYTILNNRFEMMYRTSKVGKELIFSHCAVLFFKQQLQKKDEDNNKYLICIQLSLNLNNIKICIKIYYN